MKQIKVKYLKVYQSVKIGSKEHLFLKDTEFDMTLSDQFVIIRDKNNNIVYVPVTNVPYIVPVIEDKKDKDEQKKSSGDTRRVSQKKHKQT